MCLHQNSVHGAAFFHSDSFDSIWFMPFVQRFGWSFSFASGTSIYPITPDQLDPIQVDFLRNIWFEFADHYYRRNISVHLQSSELRRKHSLQPHLWELAIVYPNLTMFLLNQSNMIPWMFVYTYFRRLVPLTLFVNTQVFLRACLFDLTDHVFFWVRFSFGTLFPHVLICHTNRKCETWRDKVREPTLRWEVTERGKSAGHMFIRNCFSIWFT